MVMPEVEDKLRQIRSLSDAIRRTEAELRDKPSAALALALQQLQQQRKSLQGLLPPLRLVEQ